jgi:hypothetical protein
LVSPLSALFTLGGGADGKRKKLQGAVMTKRSKAEKQVRRMPSRYAFTEIGLLGFYTACIGEGARWNVTEDRV